MQILAERLSSLRLGPGLEHGSLTMFPLVAEDDGPPAYLTLDEALGRGVARVTEISESGSVPELRFENGSEQGVLLVDGEELVGAKQNRILNVTILVGAGRTVQVPVACVEQGRWAWKSRHFASGEHSLFAKARAKKTRRVSESLRSSGAYLANQGEIWDDVSDKLDALSVRSSTGSMSDAFEQRAADIQDYVAALKPVERQVGAVFAVDGKVVGLDLFDSSATFGKLMAKLVRSYAMDAIERPAVGQLLPVEDVVREFLARLQAAALERYQAIGEGEALRIEGGVIAGGALVVGERMVHLCAFDSPV